jgi:hypothetical protein
MKINSNDIIWFSIDNISNDIVSLDIPDDKIIDEIEDYSHLNAGWSFGEGELINGQTILNAKTVYLACKLHGISVEHYANEDGTITLIAYINDHFLEIEVDDTILLNVRYAVGKGDDYKVVWRGKIILLSEIEYELLELQSQCKFSLNPLSESSTLTNLALNSKSLEGTKFLLNTREASQFSAKIAQG